LLVDNDFCVAGHQSATLFSAEFVTGAAAALRETWPTVGSLALPADDHLSEFLTKTLDLLRVRCCSKVVGKFEEGFLF